MDQAVVKALYSEKAAFYHKLFVDFALYGRGLRAAVAKYAPIKAGMRVLDAGCGTGIQGRNLHAIAQRRNLHDISYNGFDLTPAMMNLFQAWIDKEKPTGIKIAQADVLKPDDLPAEWTEYDFVVSSGMLEHLHKHQLAEALRNLAARMRDEGTMMVFITRKNWMMKYLIQIWWKAHMYEREEVANTFREAGLSPRFLSFPFPYWHLNIWGFVIAAQKAGAAGSGA